MNVRVMVGTSYSTMSLCPSKTGGVEIELTSKEYSAWIRSMTKHDEMDDLISRKYDEALAKKIAAQKS